MNPTHESTLKRIPNLGGVILCGGQSSRMGSDKSKLLFHGQSFLQHAVSKMSQVAGPVVISVQRSCYAATNHDGLIIPDGVKFVVDELAEQGPLEGLRVGLQSLAADVQWAFVSGCDAPLIEPKLIAHLAGLIGDYQAVVPVDGKRIFGLTAVYRTDIAEQIIHLMQRQQRRVIELVKSLTVKYVDVKTLLPYDPELGSLMNVNRPDDYAELLRRFDAK